MGPFKRYITSIMAFFTPFNFVTLCQFYCTTSPVPFTKLQQETIEREGKSLATVSHTHNTRWSNSGCLEISSHKTRVYGRHSINMNAIYSWNYLQKLHVNILFMNYQKQSSEGVL